MTQQLLVTGATGHLGKATIEFLLKKGIPAGNIHALVRDETKAAELGKTGIHLKYGNYDDYASLVKAFIGIDKLLLVSGNDITGRLQQQINAVNAAKEAGVKHILYTSFIRKNETETSPISFVAQSHIVTEKHILSSGLNYTILKNGIYTDMLPVFFGEKALETGIYFPAGEGRAAYATRSNMAEVAANILAGEGHENKIYTIANTGNYSIRDAAQTLTELTGKNITYTSPSFETYVETATGAGMPAEYANMFAAFAEAIRQEEFESKETDMERLLGRQPDTLKDYLKGVYSN